MQKYDTIWLIVGPQRVAGTNFYGCIPRQFIPVPEVCAHRYIILIFAGPDAFRTFAVSFGERQL
ncbi:MAG TPA: hypothetical protein VHI13_12390 [Candidatus Kapabacteria bacterium]|nr:hypothetical protein [Candidatus Kapabacteria bacterium]